MGRDVEVHWSDRAHFFAAPARAMRRILEFARAWLYEPLTLGEEPA